MHFKNIIPSQLSELWLHRWWVRPRVKILVVTDGAVAFGPAANNFGISKVIQILQTNGVYPWVRFTVHGADRDGVSAINTTHLPHQNRYMGFRFTMPDFNINDYDQVWFFGFNPGNNSGGTDADINQPGQAPLSDSELRVLSEWMDTQQGGVFATGDHHYLGASMCSRIPRVRNMRKWTIAQGVPPRVGFNRKDTNQPDTPAESAGIATIDFSAQGDATPQPIEVVMTPIYNGTFTVKYAPHPILCGVNGIIDKLPDHPHEGEIIEGSTIDTTLTFSYNGYTAPEYPTDAAGNKPIPNTIAYGQPLNLRHDKNINSYDGIPPPFANNTARFGLIGVYDGSQANIGRVVVDSTWHHWMDVNLLGMESAADPANYNKVKNYFLNVAVWLCDANLRSQMLTASIWNTVIVLYDPMVFSVRDSIWTLGPKAKDVIGRNAGQCTIVEWILDIFLPELLMKFKLPFPFPEPCLTCPPFEIFEMAILGGIFKEMLPLVEKLRTNEQFDRKQLSADVIQKAMLRGITLGQQELQTTLEQSLKRTTELVKSLPKLNKTLSERQFALPLRKYKLSFKLNQVLLNHPIFSILKNEESYYLTAQLHIKGMEQPLKTVRIPQKDSLKFGRIDNSAALLAQPEVVFYEDAFEDGEALQIDLFLGENLPENKIQTLHFDESPEDWVGKYQPHYLELLKSNETVGVWLEIADLSGNIKPPVKKK